MKRFVFVLALLLWQQRAEAEEPVFQLYFASGSAALKDTARAERDRLVYRDLIYEGATWDIVGYAGQPGTSALNDRAALSTQRAEAVYDHLRSRSMAAGRLECAGFGHSRMKVFPEFTPEQEQANRRVEVRVLSR